MRDPLDTPYLAQGGFFPSPLDWYIPVKRDQWQGMLSQKEHLYVNVQAWVPEHLVDYVSSVSGKEPFLLGDFLCYVRGDEAVLVGYPLKDAFMVEQLKGILQEVWRRFRPGLLRVIAPELPKWKGLGPKTDPQDHYFRLQLQGLPPPPKVRNMLRRASREVALHEGRELTPSHLRLLEEFISQRDLTQRTREIMRALPRYVEKTGDCRVFSAWRHGGGLVSFAVAHLGKGEYAFYMFHITPRSPMVPGTSDLLLEGIIERAKAEGKRYINMGLGINAGVRFFKEKWGAKAFAPYVEGTWRRWNWMRPMEAIIRYMEGP